jgi:hypothetical protein
MHLEMQSGGTIGGDCEELELQGSHHILPSMTGEVDSKRPVALTCAACCDSKLSHLQVSIP